MLHSHRLVRFGRIPVALVLTAAACSGQIGGGNEPGEAPEARSPRSDSPTPPGALPGAPADPVPPPATSTPVEPAIRRLTTAQIANVLADVFDYPPEKVAALPEVGRSAGFVDSGFLQSYLLLSEDVGARATERADGFGPCTAATRAAADASACVRAGVTALGERLFRRPLAADEVAGYVKVFDSLVGGVGRAKAASALTASLLNSPHFLYSFERATRDKPQLSAHEMAARLSFSLWSSVPDDELLAAARAGRLAGRDALLAQATRMLASPKARRMSADFFETLMPFEQAASAMRDAKKYPGASPELFRDMVTETRTFLDALVWNEGGALTDLFMAPHSHVNSRLATFYGLKPAAGASTSVFTKIALPAAQRAGILTHASLLTALAHPDEAAPILRGVFVLKQLLCSELPMPPPDVGMPDPPSARLSQRERFNKHSTDAGCRACHQMIDPVGFGLETYDAVGRYVTAENGFPVTGQGRLAALDGGAADFTGALELGQLLAKSAQARRCFVRQMFEQMTGMSETPPLRGPLDEIDRQFQSEGLKIARLPLAVVGSPAFLLPRGSNGGMR